LWFALCSLTEINSTITGNKKSASSSYLTYSYKLMSIGSESPAERQPGEKDKAHPDLSLHERVLK
jgi:hypothetical protein